ncbi:hypothetical protein [Engelhardtia mirabilis]|uniref:GIY-YIG domain-containing protein n=1 Tax=Engelhardtia mirabilis TaxID=2528011 RepID=A0A518BK25_9BACT|nr:hypothetical protein Pla133_24070 [Planctomycetes bacterium Pla133]QDV01652.1 hypothetical protein Pla86_24060 [Planctomycetes bacterium Pla86]
MTKRIHYCYLLTRTLPEGGCRYYVGIRTAPKYRTPESDSAYMGSGRAIRRAVKAHPGAFSKTILDVFDTREEARAMERALVGLETANSKWSYNLVTGGEDSGLASEETKARISAANLRRFEDPAEREKTGAASRSVWASLSPEEREAIGVKRGATNRRRYQDPAERKRHRAMLKERYADPDYKTRHAESVSNVNRSREGRARNSAGNLKRYANETPKQRAARIEKATERNRALAQDPAWLEKNAAAVRRPETRAKLSASERKLCEDPAERERRSARQLKRYANETPDQKAARRQAISEGRQRAKAERARVQREVQWILAALLLNKYAA